MAEQNKSANNSQASAGSKLRTYQLFKTTIHREKYLMRSAGAQFHISLHTLNIETGRHLKQPTYVRTVCNMCNSNEIEAEIHFLVVPPAYKHLRTL